MLLKEELETEPILFVFSNLVYDDLCSITWVDNIINLLTNFYYCFILIVINFPFFFFSREDSQLKKKLFGVAQLGVLSTSTDNRMNASVLHYD